MEPEADGSIPAVAQQRMAALAEGAAKLQQQPAAQEKTAT
jgi:hypothetical protein